MSSRYFCLIDPQLAVKYLISSFSPESDWLLHVSRAGDKLALIKEQDTIPSQGEAISTQRRAIDIHEIVSVAIKGRK